MTPVERKRRQRDKERAVAAGADELDLRLRDLAVTDPAGAVAAWSTAKLVVPPGHHAAGKPMTLPPFALDWLREALAADTREALLCCARKNSKSAICAIVALACVTPGAPLVRPGFRGAVVSVNTSKASELVRQAQEIAIASGLPIAGKPADHGLFFRSRPNVSIESDGVTFEVLSADRSAGHASGFDLLLVDELGILAEKDRPLLSGLRSSTSTRDGKLLAISIMGDSPFIPELLERRDEDGVVVHHYAPPRGADPLDPATWAYSNPGLGTIKSVTYMQYRAKAVANNPADLALFATEDVNIAGSIHYESIVTVGDWKQLETVAERDGPAVVGIDLGSTDSLSAAAVLWPISGRLEVYACCATSEDYTLHDRGRADGVGDRYVQLAAAAELFVYPGQRTTPVKDFLRELAGELAGHKVEVAGADRYRQSELLDSLAAVHLNWNVQWRGQGKGVGADGSLDIRCFQRSVRERWLRPVRGHLLLTHAIAESAIERDPLNNCRIIKNRARGRIDPLSATVIATGLGERLRERPVVKYRRLMVGEAVA